MTSAYVHVYIPRSIKYSMHKNGSKWKSFDLEVDGRVQDWDGWMHVAMVIVFEPWLSTGRCPTCVSSLQTK